ncbi:MAG: JmjC domain-containing protein, partial [Gammaproteobacteria bacterium]
WRVIVEMPRVLFELFVGSAPVQLLDLSSRCAGTPKDMLYLPPRIGHWGVALEPCMTYSVGYRAPDGVTLASRGFDHWLESAPLDNPRFTDPGRAPTQEPYAISRADLTELLALTRRWLEPEQGFLENAILAQLSEPKPGLDPQPLTELPEDWRDQSWQRHPASRAIYHRRANGGFILAVGGISAELERDDQALIEALCREDAVGGQQLADCCQSDGALALVKQLILEGHLESL